MNNIKINSGVAESIINSSDIKKMNKYFFKREAV
jgi:hypothetical protein